MIHHSICKFPVENPKHSDFIKLRTMLISTHMQDLKDVTEDVHYENFRAQCISQISQHARERGYVPFFTFIFKSTVLFFSKLKRDSVPYDSDISETDKLLLQKDEEVRIYTGTHLLWILIYVIF